MLNNNKTVVETGSGKLEGIYKNGLYIFKGIPYAAPPTNGSRWLPPQPVKPWTGIRQARVFGPIAPQNRVGINFLHDNPVEELQSEDCLYLNVWTPYPDASHRPVLLWIHGGAFNVGSGSDPVYSGDNLAGRGDVVVVTINYRLGSLGFLHLDKVTGGRIPATGNEGILDQIAALQWVRDNIAWFGGDSNNITIFGESAGAMSIGCLLAMPQARGLFHKAILQSGSNTVKSLYEAIQLTEQFLDILGIKPEDTETLKSVPVSRLISAQLKLAAMLKVKGSIMEPVVDGKTLPEMPIDAVNHGSANKVALLIGTNLEEAKFMARMEPDMTKIDEAGLIRRWQRVLPPHLVPDLVENCRKALAREGRTADPAELAIALQTDRQFRIPAVRLLESQRRNGGAAYSYLFTWKSPQPDLGACHALEIGFVFGSLSASFNGTGPKVEKLAKNIQDAWIAFAKTGSPNCQSLGNWPQYGSKRETMLLGESCHLEEMPYDEERRAWDPIPNVCLG